MLRLSQEIHDHIVAHARADHPDEACGIVAGLADLDEPDRWLPMRNADRSPTSYAFDPHDLLDLHRELDGAGEEIAVVYHSHPSTSAYPSATDVAFAGEPQAHYVLVSTRDIAVDEFRSFRILDGVVTEEAVLITPSGAGGIVMGDVVVG